MSKGPIVAIFSIYISPVLTIDKTSDLIILIRFHGTQTHIVISASQILRWASHISGLLKLYDNGFSALLKNLLILDVKKQKILCHF